MKNKPRSIRYATPVLIVAAVGTVIWVNAGSLSPPAGPVSPTMKTLVEVEPRVMVNNLPGGGTYKHGITQPGSYYLTGDVVSTLPGETGILIAADNVTLDLNGFALVGAGGAGGSGVTVSGAHIQIVVRNGTVRDWGGDGIDATGATNTWFEHLLLSQNGGSGLRSGMAAVITACVAHQNAAHGIEVADNSVVEGCAADANVTAGVRTVGGNNRIERNHATDNDEGFQIGGSANLLVKNSAKNNSADYSIGAGNVYGPIVPAGNGGDLVTITNGNHPWANFSLACTPQVWCRDQDNDSYGTNTDTVNACTPPPGYVANCADCDDSNAARNPGATEICNAIDDNCDGTVDEGNPGGGVSCSTGFPGVCAAGTTVCQSGALTCQQNVSPSSELCDNLDNDCDGMVDEGNPGGGGSCNTGLLGVCAAGTAVCQGGVLTCQQNVSASTEVCDSLDNDCDGIVDDGVCLANGNACAMSSQCSSGFCVDGMCCNNACTSLCLACSAALTGGANGTCAPILNGTDPQNECTGASNCNGSGGCTP